MSDIHHILKTHWGYSAFRPMQEQIIQSVLEKNDTLALLPTGGGKSICFQIPAMAMEGVCIVISPLIALMKDQVEQLKARGISAISVFSGMSKREIDVALDNCVYGGVKFLYVSPERIKTELFQERVKRMKVCLLAIDEAHCISQWGYDFRPAYLTIQELRPIIKDVPVIALTATATDVVKKDIQEKLLFKTSNVFQKSFARDNLSYSVFNAEDKERKIVEVLKNVQGSSVIYLRSRKKTKEMALYLRKHGIKCDFYHAGLPNAERSQKQDFWIEGKTRVIAATNAFGMGIDKPDVRTVIHWEPPATLEAYYQEAGRAGRDEKKAYAVLLYNDHDLKLLEQKVEEAYPSLDFIKKVYQCLSNYYKIAIGSSNLASYDFDSESFENMYRLPKVETYHALRILEKEGLIQLNENFNQPSRLFFLMNSKDLYDFQIANEKFDVLIKTILRMYGGELFSSYCHVNESSIARNVTKTVSQVSELLKQLDKFEVVDYQPQKDTPQLVFTRARVDVAKLSINVKELERRKDSDLEKARMVANYAMQDVRCRTLVLLDYFGEVSDSECGVCDICLRKKREKQRGDPLYKVRLFVLNELQNGSRFIEDITASRSIFSKDKIVEVIRQMIDVGEVHLNDKGQVEKTDN